MAVLSQEAVRAGKGSFGQKKSADADALMRSALKRIPRITAISNAQRDDFRRQILAARRYISRKASGSIGMAERLAVLLPDMLPQE